MKQLILALVALCSFSGIVGADCGGTVSARRQPIRSFLQRKPIRSAMQRTVQPMERTDCSSPENTYEKTMVSCAPSRTVTMTTTVQQTTFIQSDRTFGLTEQPEQVAQPVPTPTVQQVQAVPVPVYGLESYNRAYASASYRAANQIRGHVRGELLPNRASSAGVGFATNNPNPRTCLGVPGRTSATCAVVRGPDGWYSTCVRP